MTDRGERRRRTRLAVKRRLRKLSAGLIMGVHPRVADEPHRAHKHKPKFTAPNSSLKADKQINSRASRHRAKRAIMSGKDVPPEPKSSIKWNYW